MPQVAFILKLAASFWIRSKAPEIVRWNRPTVQRDEKDAEVIGLKNREGKIEDFEFLKFIEERIKISEQCSDCST